jgi:hypothetical protein
VSDIDTAVVDSLKVLDPEWPIREADNSATSALVRYWSNSEHCSMPALIALVANNYCNADAGEYDPALGAEMTADRRFYQTIPCRKHCQQTA